MAKQQKAIKNEKTPQNQIKNRTQKTTRNNIKQYKNMKEIIHTSAKQTIHKHYNKKQYKHNLKQYKHCKSNMNNDKNRRKHYKTQ